MAEELGKGALGPPGWAMEQSMSQLLPRGHQADGPQW